MIPFFRPLVLVHGIMLKGLILEGQQEGGFFLEGMITLTSL
jgi:hypothetical protein